MGNGDQTALGVGAGLMTPQFMAVVAEAIAAALAKSPSVEAGPAETAAPASLPTQIGDIAGKALAPLAAPILIRATNRLASRKLWVTVGTVATLVAQNPIGLNLPPVAQVAIAGLAAIYVAAQAIVDSGKAGGGNG